LAAVSSSSASATSTAPPRWFSSSPAALAVLGASKAADLLHAHRGGAVLVALADDELTAAKSFRNLSRVHVLHVDDVGVADLVRAVTLVISQSALDNLTSRARKEAKS
jgi:large subunit ribosomal protein L4